MRRLIAILVIAIFAFPLIGCSGDKQDTNPNAGKTGDINKKKLESKGAMGNGASQDL